MIQSKPVEEIFVRSCLWIISMHFWGEFIIARFYGWWVINLFNFVKEATTDSFPIAIYVHKQYNIIPQIGIGQS
jgi:hypothetical protein